MLNVGNDFSDWLVTWVFRALSAGIILVGKVMHRHDTDIKGLQDERKADIEARKLEREADIRDRAEIKADIREIRNILLGGK